MLKLVNYFVVITTMVLAGIVAATDLSDSTYDGDSSQPSVLLHNSHAPCQGGETVMVIQDTVEWFAPDDERGNVVTELIAQGKNWCSMHSHEIAGANLAPFGDIIISSAQNQAFYDNLFPGGVIDQNLDAWVLGGGILSANLADHASGAGAGGTWDGDVFVGGLQHVFQSSDSLTIAAATHPIITGEAPCPSANCGAITDTERFVDLDGWNSSTHGFFTALPEGTTVILVDAMNRPVMIEYPHGSGVVVATMTTSEWMYGGRLGQAPSGPRDKKLLANEIAYQESLVGDDDDDDDDDDDADDDDDHHGDVGNDGDDDDHGDHRDHGDDDAEDDDDAENDNDDDENDDDDDENDDDAENDNDDDENDDDDDDDDD